MMRCSGEPVSWLRLELYGLGELPEPEARLVEQHLGECPACQACYERVAAPAPLPAAVVARPKRASWRVRPLWAAGSVVAAALAGWLIATPRAIEPPGQAGVKGGGGVEIELVRVDERGAQLEPTHFAASDRFKVLVSCATEAETEASVLVFQGGQAFVAVPAYGLGACGNRRGLPGAFRVSGESAADVCVVLSKPGAELGTVQTMADLSQHHACTRLEPSPPN